MPVVAVVVVVVVVMVVVLLVIRSGRCIVDAHAACSSM